MFDFINLTLQELIRKFNCKDVCLSYLEERFWNNVPVSPFDPSLKVYNYGNHKYRYRNTGKNFNVKTNTLFHRTKVPLDKWFGNNIDVDPKLKISRRCHIERMRDISTSILEFPRRFALSG